MPVQVDQYVNKALAPIQSQDLRFKNFDAKMHKKQFSGGFVKK